MNARLRPLAVRIALSVEIVREYIAARMTMRDGDVRKAVRFLRDEGIRGDGRTVMTAEAARRLGRAVERVSAFLPAKSRCLLQSLILSRMLAKRGTPSRLVIGVRPGEKFGAHAWVELAGTPLLPPGGTEFAKLVEL